MKALALSLLLLSSTSALSAPTHCVTMTEELFMGQVRSMPFPLMKLKPERLADLLIKMNDIRAGRKLWALEADKMIAGFGRHRVNVVMFKDGCIVPGTMQILETIDFVNLGLKLEHFDPL